MSYIQFNFWLDHFDEGKLSCCYGHEMMKDMFTVDVSYLLWSLLYVHMWTYGK